MLCFYSFIKLILLKAFGTNIQAFWLKMSIILNLIVNIRQYVHEYIWRCLPKVGEYVTVATFTIFNDIVYLTLWKFSFGGRTQNKGITSEWDFPVLELISV